MKVDPVKEQILEMIYNNMSEPLSDPDSLKAIKAHFEQALTLVAETSDEKTFDTASAKTGN